MPESLCLLQIQTEWPCGMFWFWQDNLEDDSKLSVSTCSISNGVHIFLAIMFPKNGELRMLIASLGMQWSMILESLARQALGMLDVFGVLPIGARNYSRFQTLLALGDWSTSTLRAFRIILPTQMGVLGLSENWGPQHPLFNHLFSPIDSYCHLFLVYSIDWIDSRLVSDGQIHILDGEKHGFDG